MEAAAAVLAELIRTYEQHDATAEINEAATRLLIIDRVLHEVLGWPQDGFNPEEPVETADYTGGRKHTGWLDYHLRQPLSDQRLVVEAKRTGVHFSLTRTKKRRTVPLVSLMQNFGDPLRQTLEQARTYCIDSGTDAFVVTNGLQWIGSIAFAHTVPLAHLQAVVFDSLGDISDNLSTFLDFFSPEGVASRRLAQAATGNSIVVPKFAGQLHNGHPQTQSSEKNYLAAPLQMLMNLCFGDLTSAEHSEMLERCYVETDATTAGLSNLEAFVGANLPFGWENSRRLDRGDDGPKPFPEPLGVRGGTVLLAGRAGSGKSTFIAHTKRRLIKQFADFKHVVLHCDLLDKTAIHAKNFDHDRFIDEVSGELLTLAESAFPDLNPYDNSHLVGIFQGEIRRRENSLAPELRGTQYSTLQRDEVIQRHLSQPLTHLKAYLGYLDRLQYATTVLLDNVDRGTPEFERVTFQFASQLGRNSRATVVVSLRDTTVEVGKRQNFLDVRQCPVVTISPPPFLEVAETRFRYAREELKRDLHLWRRFHGSLAGQPAERTIEFAEILADLVLRPDSGIADMITALSGTNLRIALALLADFCVSPWTDLNRMFRAYRQEGWSGSTDDFLRSVMRRDKRRYIEDEHVYVINVFRADASRLVSHFLGVRILQYLSWQYRKKGDKDIPGQKILAVFSGIGYPADDVRAMLDRLGRFALVGSLSRGEPPWEEEDSIRLGISGEYYLEELIYSREYIYNIADDCILYDHTAFAKLRSAETDRTKDFVGRFNTRLLVFLQYLRKHELEELQRIGPRRTQIPWLEEVTGPIMVQTLGRNALSERDYSSGG